MTRVIALITCLLPALASAQTQPTSTRVTNSNGSVVAAVQSTATAGTEAGLVVRVAGTVNTTGSVAASTGTNGATAPTSSTQVGGPDALGNLRPAAVINSSPSGSEYGMVVRMAGGASGGTSSTFGAAFPATGTAAGMSDGTNMQAPRVFDGDSGGGTQYVQGVMLRASGSGGTTEVGTSVAPLRIDPTGTTTQPVSGSVTVSGTVAATQSGTWTVQPGNTANTTPWLTSISQGGNTASVSASNALKVDGSAVTQPVSGTVAATQSGTWSVQAQDGSGNALASATAAPASGDRGLVVRVAPAASIVAGQQAVTGAAVALPSVAVQQVCVKHVVGGAQSVIYVGPTGVTTGTGYPLEQGDSACYAADSVSDLFVIAAGVGSTVAYTGVP